MTARQMALFVCLVIQLVTPATGASSKVVRANARVPASRDERTHVQHRTEVPVPEIKKWGCRSMRAHFVVINDTHVGPDDMRGLDGAMLRLKNQKPDFIVFTGDLTRGQGESESTKRASFKTLLEAARKAERPFYLGMGNTDMVLDASGDPTRVFRESTGTAPYYSFESGGVHFVMLYTEGPKPSRVGTVSDQQLRWLQADLQAMGHGMPVVLFGHHPLYPDESKWEQDNWSIDNARQLFEVLEPYHLIATFCSHRHLNRMSLDARGVLHVINGSMVGDHSDDVGPKKDGIGYRWVVMTPDKISTTWIRIGVSDIPKR